MSSWTLRLNSSRGSKRAVGGKAAGLRRLVGEGFDVPPGFCVKSMAFDRIVDDCIDEAEDLDGFRGALREAPLPGQLIDEVRRHVDEIGAQRWAVRSSAVEEDSERASFAGQHHTEIDVGGPEAILDAVRRVWAEAFRIEGLVYRSRLRVDAVPGSMAVLVQAMVDADVGGVMFTRPVETEGTSLEVSVSEGTGEEAVEGRSGEYYRLERPAGTSSRRETIGAEESSDGLLDAPVRRELVELADRIEEVAGDPRDVEFAVGRLDGGEATKTWILQQRPLTDRIDAEVSVWTNANVGEALPGVATPLTWSIIGRFSERGFEQAFGTLGLDVPEEAELVGSFRGRVYLNLGEFVTIASGIPILKPDVLFEMAGGGGLDLVRDIAENRPVWQFLRRLPVTGLRILASQLSMPLVAPLWSAYFDRRKSAFVDRRLEELGRGELVDQRDRLDELFDRTGRVTLTCSSNFLMSYVVMKKWLGWFGRGGAERERALFGALEVESAEPVLDLLELSRAAREIDEVREVFEEVDSDEVLAELERRAEGSAEVGRFLDELEDFRRRHGHRAPREAELATPRWREEPRFVVELLAQYIDREDLPSRQDYHARQQTERREVDALIDRTFDSIDAPIFRGILVWARETARLREAMRSHVVEMLDMYRRFFLECGRRLVDEGVLGRAEDVFYLRYDEIGAWLEFDAGRARERRRLPLYVMVRRALVDRLREMPDPPNSFVLSDGTMIDEREYRSRSDETDSSQREEDFRAVLGGLPGRGGRVSGRARVVEHPDEGVDLEPGEILVAPYTDVGWTPLFMTAKAVVMELGGPLSHACIVAREFGVPTVVNVRGATERIATGDEIVVDGDEGLVYLK